jgi:uncharacterized membrane protein YhaH (DUF805 family)
MEWYLKVVRDNYANFQGRARRQEYWMYALINLMIVLVLGIFDTLLFSSGNNFISGIYSLAVLVPGIAVSVRRLHDTDRSGWWLLLVLIPIIGIIILLVLMCIEGNSASNRFGTNPKAGITLNSDDS